MRIRVEFVKMSGIRYNPRDVADGHRVRRLPKEATDKWLDVAPEEMAGPLCNIHSGDFVHDQPEEALSINQCVNACGMPCLLLVQISEVKC